MPRSPLLLALLGLALCGCSGTRFGDALSGSFSAPPAAAPVTTPAVPPVSAALAGPPAPSRPAASKPLAAAKPPAPASKPAPPAAPPAPASRPVASPPAGAIPYRVTLRLPQADPAAPAEALTQALRAAGVSFTVERIETIGGPGTAGAPAPAAPAAANPTAPLR